MAERDLLKRTKQFALRTMKLAGALPQHPVAQTLARQLVRSGTSVGANYRAACRARSKKEFIAKLGHVEEEADESAFWMELIIEGGVMNSTRVEPLRDEADQLTRIVVRSRISAGRNLDNHKSQIANRK